MKLISRHPVASTIVGVILTFVIANKLSFTIMAHQSLANQLMSLAMLNVSLLAMSPNVFILCHRHFSKIPEMRDTRLTAHMVTHLALVIIGVSAILATPFLNNNDQNNLLLCMVVVYPIVTYVAMMTYANTLKRLDQPVKANIG